MTAPHLDHVGRIIVQWGAARPDLDVSPMGLIGRLHRLAGRLNDELRPVFAEAGLGDGDFDVLAALRRSGARARADARASWAPRPWSRPERSPSGSTGSSGSAWSPARSATSDARSRRVALTEKGRTLVDGLLDRHVANEHRLVSGLSKDQRVQLAGLLEAWGRALDA